MWNLLGIGAPVLVALIAIPQLIHRLGVDRFGVLTLAWVVVGYFGLFDVGLGRALTKLTAEFLGQHRDSEIPVLFWTSILLTGLLGLLGMATLALLTPWLVEHVLKMPVAIRGEAVRSFYVLSLSVPIVIWTGTLRGFLEAHQRFDLVNAASIPLSVLTYAGPFLVLPFSTSLFPIVVVLAVGRVVAGTLYWSFCLRVEPRLRERMKWGRREMKPLLRFGGWMSVSNAISPLMMIADRFVIGALLGTAAVAYYATPFEVVTKVLVIPAAVVSVLFPAFSTGHSLDPSHTAKLFERGTKCTFLILFPILLAVAVFARPGLTLWLGASLASHSARVLEWLAAGVLLNGVAQVPFWFVLGVGRPDLTAKLHMVELLAYGLLLWWLIRAQGIEGAAMAWTIRVGLDAAALFFLSRRLIRSDKVLGWRTAAAAAAAAATILVSMCVTGTDEKVAYTLIVLAAFALLVKLFFLSDDEREALSRWHIRRSLLEDSVAGE